MTRKTIASYGNHLTSVECTIDEIKKETYVYRIDNDVPERVWSLNFIAKRATFINDAGSLYSKIWYDDDDDKFKIKFI